MVNFEASEGFSMNGSKVAVDVSQLPDEAVLDMLTEAHDIAKERGLELTNGLGSIAVVGPPEQPIAQDIVKPWVLVATLEESGRWYTKVANELNSGRSKKQKVQVVPEDELPGMAEAWLTEERQVAIGDGLDYEHSKPVIIMPLPNTPVSHEETVQTWTNTRGRRLWGWGGRMAFLKQWSADQLSGYDPQQADELVRFAAIETAYTGSREGTRDEQLDALKGIQLRNPAVRSATLFEGGVLSNRYSDDPRPDWRDTYVRQIELNPDRDRYVPRAAVYDGSEAYVDVSPVEDGAVSRRLVG